MAGGLNSSSDVRTSPLGCFGFKINQEEIRFRERTKEHPFHPPAPTQFSRAEPSDSEFRIVIVFLL